MGFLILLRPGAVLTAILWCLAVYTRSATTMAQRVVGTLRLTDVAFDCLCCQTVITRTVSDRCFAESAVYMMRPGDLHN